MPPCTHHQEGATTKQGDDMSEDKIQVFAGLSAPTAREGRVLYISRHGESEYNLENRIGGDPNLSPRGLRYAKALGGHINGLAIQDLKVWTSQLHRTQQTAAHVSAPRSAHAALNEIGSGDYDHLTYQEFEDRHPKEFHAREAHKLTYRYPNGESYVDVCRRLEPLLSEMDRTHNLLVVSHQAVIRCILAFLTGNAAEEVPYTKVPLHCVLKVTFSGGENRIEYHHLPIECVDTYRPKSCSPPPAQQKQHSSSKDGAVRTGNCVASSRIAGVQAALQAPPPSLVI